MLLEESTIRRHLVDFETRFGRGEALDLYFAPGRVNLMGEHTDYNGGFVLPIAIEQGTYLFLRRSELPPARLYSANRHEEARFHPGDIKKEGDWADYVRGVFFFALEFCPELPPFDGLYFGDLAMGAGLSSSASIELVTAVGLTSLGCRLTREQTVKVGLKAENDFVGFPCGVMDQFTVAFARKGHAILLDCETLEYRHVPFNIEDASLVVVHTGVNRSLLETPYRKRREECERALKLLSLKIGERKNLRQVNVAEFERARWSIPDTLAARAEHVIYDNLRVEKAALCLETGDSEELGRLMNSSHSSYRDLFEATSREVDILYDIINDQPGVLGCKLTGGGFGGCLIALVENEAVEHFIVRIPDRYWEATYYEPEISAVRPGMGARRMPEEII